MAVKRRTGARNYQPAYLLQPSGKWLSRGLQQIYLGNRLVWNRDEPHTKLTPGGTPKFVTSKVGFAQGFNTTYGTGTTDSLTGPKLVTGSSRGGRSIVAHVLKNGAGGGGFGRIFDAGNSGAGSEYFYNGTANLLTYVFYPLAASVSWTAGHAIPNGVASVQGMSLDLSATGKQAYFYNNGTFTGVANPASTPANYSVHNNTVVYGNRTSDNARCWDGYIACVLIFDSVLTAQEHETLAANPYQVFTRVTRRTTSAGTTFTITPSGGITLSGAPSQVHTHIQTPSSGVAFGGTAPITFVPFGTTFTITPTGGFTLSGSPDQIHTRIFTCAGGFNVAGTVPDYIKTHIQTPSGLVQFAGSSPLIFIPAGGVITVPQRTVVGSGV